MKAKIGQTNRSIWNTAIRQQKRRLELEVKDFMIPEELRIIEAIQKLDTLAKKTLFLVKQDRLVATLTDGDVRRWLLKGGELEAEVRLIANYNPKYLLEKNRQQAYKKLREWEVEAIPILNDEQNITSIILWNHHEIRVRHDLNVPTVIMAGGFGTRLYPYTKILPKPLIPIGEIPIAEHIINRFHSFGVADFYLIVNHKKNMIKAYFNETEKEYQITYVDEDTPLGTGGGISLLRGQIDQSFFLTNCDILIDADYEEIYHFHQKSGNVITMICARQNIQIPYGVVETDAAGEITEMKEKPELSFLTNAGVYVVEPQVIEDLPDGTIIGFPEIINAYRKRGQKVGTYIIGADQWLDMGQIEEMEKMLSGLEIREQ